MGKPKKDRTGQVIDAGKRIVLAEQIQNTLEQHRFDRFVDQGVIVRAVQLDGRMLLLGTERGVEPPLSVLEESMLKVEAGGRGSRG